MAGKVFVGVVLLLLGYTIFMHLKWVILGIMAVVATVFLTCLAKGSGSNAAPVEPTPTPPKQPPKSQKPSLSPLAVLKLCLPDFERFDPTRN